MTKLIELLETINENTNVLVRDTNGNDLAIYDGKNSINEIYNDCEVFATNEENDFFVIYIINNVEVYYDLSIEKYFTFQQIKDEYEEVTEETVTDEEIKNFIFENLFSNGGNLVNVFLTEVIKDANDGIPTAKQFLNNL